MMENFGCLQRVAKIFCYIATPPVRFGSAKKFREYY